MIVIGPLTIRGAWDTISSFNSFGVRVLLSAGIVLLEFVGGALLFWWNEVACMYGLDVVTDDLVDGSDSYRLIGNNGDSLAFSGCK